jgi:hypothetical protein
MRIFVLLFFYDFTMKVIVGTKFSPTSRLAVQIVRAQAPEYVPAIQKRFAWAIDWLLSGTMLAITCGFGIQGLPNRII